jgi:pyruvate dehydrogenase E1 component beta subunit
MRTQTYREALGDALRIALDRDPLFYIAGEDVGRFGGAHGVTQGLWADYGGERLRDTPISETAILGHAVGAAAAGMRPCVEIMYVDFMAVCMDELINQAAKMHYLFAGKIDIPLVVRTLGGAGLQAAAQHSQSLEALFTHIPGLKVVAPATPSDAKGLFLTSVDDQNPVVFLEHKLLYDIKGECQEGEYGIPLGKADIARAGDDVSILCWSFMRHVALEAAERLAEQRISAEVVDLRTLKPLDLDTIVESVRRTHRVAILHEAVKTSGFGAELSALIMEHAFDDLDAPVLRIAAPDIPVPFNPKLEACFMPDADRVVSEILDLLE